MKRFVCGILCLVLLWTGFSFAAAEEEGLESLEELGLTEEEIRELEELRQKQTDEVKERSI